MTPYYDHGGVTIYHGDCREVLPGKRYNAVITDPPYGVGARYGDSYDDRRDGYWDWFVPTVAIFRTVAPLVTLTHRVRALQHLKDWDWVAVWNKPGSFGARVGNSPVLPHWEPIFLWGIHSLGTRREAFSDVLSYNPERGGKPTARIGREQLAQTAIGHPFPKPTGLFRRLIALLTSDDDVIVDPFAGSGTTLEAARALGRRAIGIEIEERYCEIAAERLSQEVLPLTATDPAPNTVARGIR